MKRFRYGLAITIAFLIIGGDLTGSQSISEPALSATSRAYLKQYLDKRKSKTEADTSEIVGMMDSTLRHEDTPELLRMVTNRANSSKTGGFLDGDLFKKFVAIFAFDFRQHDQMLHQNIQDQKDEIEQLKEQHQAEIEQLKIEFDQAKLANRKELNALRNDIHGQINQLKEQIKKAP